MKKIYMILLLLLIIPAFNASALTCSATENLNLKKEANNVEISYDMEDLSTRKTIKVGSNKTAFEIPRYKFNVSVYNIRDDIYVKVTNDIDRRVITIYPNVIQNGTYSFAHNDYANIYTYKLSVYSYKDECKDELIGVKKLVVPKYNPYSEYEYCKNSDEDFCKKFIKKDIGVDSDDAFLEMLNEKNASQKEKTFKEQIISNKNKLIIVAMSTAIVAIAVVILWQLLRRRHDKEL